MGERRAVRVLVVDDSPLCVDVLASCIARDDRLQVAGVAYDGLRAVELAKRLRPSVITMDLHMPRLDGVGAIRRIMRESPTRILVVTGADDRSSAAFEAMRRGASDLMEKPRPGDGGDALCARIWALARAPRADSAAAPVIPRRRARGGTIAAVGVVASTGGPAALNALVRELPADLAAPLLVVQHLPVGFASRLASWLDAASPLDVALARDGERLAPGRVLLAPDGHHLVVDAQGVARLTAGAAVDGHLPSGTRLLESLARAFGPSAAGVVLTGMGRDGVEGLLAMRRAGAATLAQDQSSSVVYGMPRAALESGAAELALPLEALAAQLRELTGRRRTA